jgi:AAA15 family ATPase/GTPase
MLLRFGVTNDMSIHHPQELSLVAAPLKDDDAGLIPLPSPSTTRLVPAAVIYGANASGKSNVIKAMRHFQSAILNSHRSSVPGKGIQRSPFRLAADAHTLPTQFDVDVVIDGVRYHYGFSANSKEYLAEWLYSFPSGRKQMLFDRQQQDFTFGRALKGRNRVIADLTRDNSLFLSAAAQNGHDELLAIWKYFQDWDFDENVKPNAFDVHVQFANREIDKRVGAFLKKIGTGINDINIISLNYSNDDVIKIHKLTEAMIDISGEQKNHDVVKFLSEITTKGSREIVFERLTTEGDSVQFSIANESDGTQRLFVLLHSIFHALDTGSLLVVDEIDASLHTKAAEAILALFNDRDTNPHGAQLITTTHDTNLLRTPGLRRDQIWFTEKDAGGATHLYPLSDFRTRTDDNFEKGYLQGRYGAIPFAGDVRGLLRRGG